MSGPSGAYEHILTAIRAARSAIRRSDAVSGFGLTVLVAGGVAVVLVAADNLFRPAAGVRIGLLLVAAAAIGATFVLRVVRPATRRVNDDAVAVKIERAAGLTDNSVINALQLGREAEEPGLSGAFVASVVRKGAAAAGRVSPSRVADWRRMSRALALGAVAVVLVVVYAVLLPRHFANAVERYARPGEFVPPVSSLSLDVLPGDRNVIKGRPLTVTMTAKGSMPSSARLLVERDGGFAPSEMPFNGREFSFLFQSVTEGFRYRVEAGDAATRVFSISVTEPPAIRSLTLTYEYPPYLSVPPRTETNAGGEIRAVVGTKVRVRAELTQPVTDAALAFGDDRRRQMVGAGDRLVSGEILVTKDDTWRILLRSADGLGSEEAVRHRISAIPDEPPDVEITAPGRDMTVTLPARLAVTLRARDDHGLGEVALVARFGDTGDERVLKTWTLTGDLESVRSFTVDLGAGDLPPGETLIYRAEARDLVPGGGQVGRSRTYTVRAVAAKDRAAEAGTALADLAARLRDLIDREEGLRRDTESLRLGVVSGGTPMPALSSRASSVAEDQSRLGAEMVGVAGSVPEGVPALAEVRGALLSLAVNEVMAAVRMIQDSRARTSPADASRDLGGATAEQGRIIEKLRELLGGIESPARRMEENPEAWLDESMSEGDRDKALRDALAKLKKFIREQEDVLKQTQDLEKKDVDDFTDEDLALLEKLAAQESDLSRFLEDLKDDLSKIPDQDFAQSTLLKELIEAYSEVELAADALTRKDVEMAVPREQSGLELAESLVENIEKWLPDVRDNLKWNMEEMDGEYPEIPMAELPDQLEDLMGDLIEEEEQLGEDADDVTSGWADSIDKGAGWGVADGPISNMSAQGKTGNTLPNSSEVGGRSGEGRSGRSHGEMVEGEADGKGGRRTPTRLTPDAWEGKSVKDSSTDPLGGATGGGKLAGGAGEGLAGPLPPEVKADLGRLSGNQVAIRQKAEALDRALKARHYPSEDLSRSVVLMKEMEDALAKGDVAGFSRRHGVLVTQMKDGQATVLEHARAMRDRSRAVPKELMRELESVDLSGLPEGYRDMLREYYKILSRGGAK